jgi:hypothetical protein
VSRALASVSKGAKLDALIAQTGNSLRDALTVYCALNCGLCSTTSKRTAARFTPRSMN